MPKKKDRVSGQDEKIFMRFKDLPKGARFKYPDGDDIWVAIETYDFGLIVKWNGLKPGIAQSHCRFVDENWTLESEVEVLC